MEKAHFNTNGRLYAFCKYCCHNEQQMQRTMPEHRYTIRQL